MAHAGKVEVVMVELDCLLDSRLGAMNKIAPAKAAALLGTEQYLSREIDQFDGVDMEAFRKAYAERDLVTLRDSTATNMFGYLLGMIGRLSREAVVRPYHDGCKIVVNHYPYLLSDAQKAEMEKVVAQRLRQLAEVTLESLSPEQLEPTYCKTTFSAMFMYNPWTWLNLHTAAFARTRLPDTLLYAPALYIDRQPSSEEIAQATQDAPHPFVAMEMQASPIVGLQLIPAKHFSSSIRLN